MVQQATDEPPFPLFEAVGDKVTRLMMGPEGVSEIVGVVVRVTDGVLEMVLVDDGAAVRDLLRVGVAVGVRVLLIVRLTELKPEGVVEGVLEVAGVRDGEGEAENDFEGDEVRELAGVREVEGD